MEKNGFRNWLSAVLPALIWLTLRWAAKGLPLSAELGLVFVILAGSVLWYCRENRTRAFRMSGRELLLWIGIGFACGFLNRFVFGKPAEVLSGAYGFLLICILGPLTEEIIYRGFVYERSMRFLPAAGAVLLNSLLFAAAHGFPAQAAFAFAAGILFSLARRKSGTVTAPAVLHIIMNMVAFFF